MPVCAPNAVEKLASIEIVVRDERGADLVHPHAAVLLRNVDRREPQSAALRSSASQHAGFLGFDAVRGGQNLLAGKLGRGGGNLPLLFVQVLRGEDLGGRAGLNKETAAGRRQREGNWRRWT